MLTSEQRLVYPGVKDASRRPAPPHVLLFFLPYLVPLLTIVTHYSSTAWHSLIPAIFVWVAIPLFDMAVSLAGSIFLSSPSCARRRSRTLAERRELDGRASFRAAIYMWPPTQLLLLVWASHRVTVDPSTFWSLRTAGLAASIGLIAAEGMNCAHELLHRRSQLERALGDMLLISVWYGHFAIEHARGHHKRVATPNDPATLRYGESFYSFLPRTLIGGLCSAWSYEAGRMRMEGRFILSPANHVVRALALQPLLPAALMTAYGARALAFFVAQAVVAVFLLEQVNAIEHYGLSRTRRPNGSYEPVGPRHSWDAPHSVSNYLMFKLQLHADHHLHVTYRYQTLELTEGSPRLPAGYLSLAPLLLIPPLWRRVMDPVLQSYWDHWAEQDKHQPDKNPNIGTRQAVISYTSSKYQPSNTARTGTGGCT